MKYGDVTLGQVEAAINKLGGYETWLQLLRDEVVVRIEEPQQRICVPERRTYPVTIPYGTMSFEEMKAAMLCKWVDYGVTEERFPLVGSGTVTEEYEILHPHQWISTPDAFRWIEDQGYRRPRDIAAGFRFAAAYPEEQRKFPIVIPIDPRPDRHGDEVLPVLYENAGNRRLRLHDVAIDCHPHYGWLAARTEKVLGS